MRTTLGVVAGYAIFALPATVLFRVPADARASITFTVAATLYGMLFAFLGAIVARKIARRRDRRAGVMVALLIAIGAAAALLALPDSGSPWPAIATLVFVAPMAIVGGRQREASSTPVVQ